MFGTSVRLAGLDWNLTESFGGEYVGAPMPKLLRVSSTGTNRRPFLRPGLPHLPAPARNLRPQPKSLRLRGISRRRHSLVASQRSLFSTARRAGMGTSGAFQLPGLQRRGAARFDLHRRPKTEAAGFDRVSI